MPAEVLDACCMINLYASGEMCSILSVTSADFHVPRIAIQEALYVLTPDQDEPQNTTLEEINLTPAIESGLLRACDLESDEENRLFVQFAAEVDDGEAACLAIAKAHGWSIATDDRKAQRLARGSHIPVVTTPELVKRWADASKTSDEEVAVVLRRMQDFGRFIPRRGSVLYQWWIARLRVDST